MFLVWQLTPLQNIKNLWNYFLCNASCNAGLCKMKHMIEDVGDEIRLQRGQEERWRFTGLKEWVHLL